MPLVLCLHFFFVLARRDNGSIATYLTEENNNLLHTFIHIFIGIVVGSVWLYLWLIVSSRVKQTIQEFNVQTLELDVKVKLYRYYIELIQKVYIYFSSSNSNNNRIHLYQVGNFRTLRVHAMRHGTRWNGMF